MKPFASKAYFFAATFAADYRIFTLHFYYTKRIRQKRTFLIPKIKKKKKVFTTKNVRVKIFSNGSSYINIK